LCYPQEAQFLEPSFPVWSPELAPSGWFLELMLPDSFPVSGWSELSPELCPAQALPFPVSDLPFPESDLQFQVE
jgi:hypothetical protein